MTKFNFNTFMGNFIQTAINSSRVYEAKTNEGRSLHKMDYFNIGIMALGAIFSAFDSKEAPPETQQAVVDESTQ